MPPRNHNQWLKEPNVEYVSSEIYSSHKIFEQEQEMIFSKVWVPICHISEMRELNNFRTTTIAGVDVIAVNEANGVRGVHQYG